MTACHDLEVALTLRAAGALDADEGARLEAHLAACPGCRTEASRTAELLDLARLPPPTLAEHRALADLSVRVAAGLKPEVVPLHAPPGVRGLRRLAAGLLVAAGIAAIVVAPALVRRERPPDAAGDGTPAVTVASDGEATWQEPDLDALWQDAAVVSLDGDDGGDGTGG